MARLRLSQRIDRAITAAAERYGINPDWMRRIARIESGWNPSATRGSYEGLFQLSEEEFRRVGGTGSRSDPDANAGAAAALLASHRDAFRRRYGTEPTLGQLYLIHQQGWGGAQAHFDNPDAPAWQNVAGTREGRARGPEWARQAIWRNIPRGDRGRFGNVESVTSRDFTGVWNERMERTPSTEVVRLSGNVGGQFPEEFDATGALEGGRREAGRVTRVTPRREFPEEFDASEEVRRSRRDVVEEERPPRTDSTPPPPATSFFDRNYPIMHALTGTDAPLGTQLLGAVFGQEGLSSNRTLNRAGAGLAAVGRSFVESANRPVQSVVPPMPQLPDQEMSAFVLPERRRRT